MISERTILWYMAFWGFGMNFMLRMNLNIAIVSMVRSSERTNDNELLKNEIDTNQNSSIRSHLVNANINDVSDIFLKL